MAVKLGSGCCVGGTWDASLVAAAPELSCRWAGSRPGLPTVLRLVHPTLTVQLRIQQACAVFSGTVRWTGLEG